MLIPVLDPSWKNVLETEFEKPYFKSLELFLETESKAGKTIYPETSLVFSAFNQTPFDTVKVVILGQDPYHGPGQAEGLSFSVPKRERIPPSLKNIYKELQADTGFEIPEHGNLEAWAKQGILLLNSTLTVEHKSPNSHSKIGWEIFTDEVIRLISKSHKHVVFMLWGKFAQSKGDLIASNKHLVLTAPHPSPFSAHTGFFGCHHFSKTNHFLMHNDMLPIDWQLN